MFSEDRSLWQRIARSAMWLLAAWAAVRLLYWPNFFGGWLMDDFVVIVNNSDVRSLGNFFEDFYPGRPLRELTYLLDYRLFGLNPAAWKWQDHFWHALCGVLVYFFGRHLHLRRLAAGAAAVLFLVHPIAIEVAANSSHRKDSLALAFLLLALITYIRSFTATGRRRWILIGLAVCLAWIGAFAKQNVVLFPAIAACYELCFVEKQNRILTRYRAVIWLVALLGLAGLTWWLTSYLPGDDFRQKATGGLAKLNLFEGAGMADYYLAMLKGWALMVLSYLWPVDLSMEYIFDPPTSWRDGYVFFSGLAIIMYGVALWWSWRRSRWTFFLLSYAGLLWLPTSNLFFYLSYFAADRYLYAPSVAPALLLGVLFFQKWPCSRLKMTAFAALVLVLAILTWRQTGIWTTMDVFYGRMLEVSPNSLVARIGLGQHYLYTGQTEKAFEQYNISREKIDRLISLGGSAAGIAHQISTGLGYCYMVKGEHDKAIDHFERAIAADSTAYKAYLNMGLSYMARGDLEEAIDRFEKALTIRPHYEEAYLNLGIAFYQQGKVEEALAATRQAIREREGFADAHFNLGNILYEQGRIPEALEAFIGAVKAAPDYRNAVQNICAIAVSTGDFEQAYWALEQVAPHWPDFAAQLRQQVVAIAQGSD